MDINRKSLLESFEKFALEGHGVVVGAPGVGKTFMLKAFCEQLLKNDVPCLYLPIDALPVDTEAALRAELNSRDYTGDFVSYLKSKQSDLGRGLGILVVDAYDAARSETVQRFYISLIRQVIGELSGLWNVIVSVRVYDARKSEELLDLFPSLAEGSSTSGFHLDDIPCRHFFVPELSDQEVEEAVKTIPHLPHVHSRFSEELKKLLRIPFNLWLLEKLLDRNPNIPELSAIGSEVQLLGLFWKQRVTDSSTAQDKTSLLTRVTQSMVSQRTLSVRTEEVYVIGAAQPWESLLSDHILRKESIAGQRVVFFHNILFDFAVSVLLIEDNPDYLVKFISEDPARPLFLRPSLNYYFTRLWHSSPVTFWTSFWHILPSSDLPMRLFARLLPPTVIVNEARRLDELGPLFESLGRNQIANDAVLRILQALRALGIQRDELWVQFLDRISQNLSREFLWELAILTLEFLKRAETTRSSEVLDACGQVSRRLLQWIWNERETNKSPWVDALGTYVVSLVTKTFGTDSKQSRELLTKVLNLVHEQHFPIRFLYELANELDKVWPYDPDFAASTYSVVFGYHEASEEKTSFGTPVLPMTSTRRQDFEMCQWVLSQHFPKFLHAAPLQATQVAIHSLNTYILARHLVPYIKEGIKLEEQILSFQFRGGQSHYLSDLSYSWDEMEHQDEPIQMAAHIFAYLAELASAQKLGELESLLDVFRDNVLTAFFWRRLLNTASTHPQTFAPLLYELAVANPIQTGNETLRELGLFIESAYPEWTEAQKLNLEQTLVALPESKKDPDSRKSLEHIRDRLLARIPSRLLITDAAKKIRETMEQKGFVPSNEPLVQFSTFSKSMTDEDWLKERGADVARDENKELTECFASLDDFSKEWQNKIPDQEAINAILPKCKELLALLESKTGADHAVIDMAWTKLAECSKEMSSGASDPNGEAFTFCRGVLLRFASDEFSLPFAESDKDYNFPHWSPGPRTAAAQGLPWLGAYRPDEPILSAIELFARDRAPSVRFLTSFELFRISEKAPEYFWRLIHYVASNETNRVVLKGVCHSLSFVISREETKTVEVLDVLFAKELETSNDSDVLSDLISLTMGLAIVRDNSWAKEKLGTLLKSPIRYAGPLHHATLSALDFIRPENLMAEETHIFFNHARDWLMVAIEAASLGIKELLGKQKGGVDGVEQSTLREIYGVIDVIVSRTYFSANLEKERPKDVTKPLSDEGRRDFYFGIKPLLTKILEFAQGEPDSVLFAPTAHHFMQLLNGVIKYDPSGTLRMAAEVARSSKLSGYNLDSLAIAEIVEFVEKILADYRIEARSDESLQNILSLLDVFADAGWPDALRLIWRLDEIFR